ncbi:MAG: DUF4124 domain-containing protein [Gammaproteobacteria bacterium]|nr:DUF4124 domain-containing protein [Gammaproteobacteria bacterium]
MLPWKVFGLVLLLAFTGAAAGAKVYKWVDEDGNVHFGDRPPADAAQELQIKVRPSTAPPSQALPGSTNRTSISEVMEEERLRRKEAREQEQQARETRQRNCVLARDKLRSFEESNYLYDVDSSGKRRILSDAQRETAEKAAREDVQRFCG